MMKYKTLTKGGSTYYRKLKTINEQVRDFA